MAYKTASDWEVKTQRNVGGIKLTTRRPTLKKAVCDLALKGAGAAAMFGIGALIGEVADHIPYINTLIPQVIDYVSGIDVAGNLDGLVGILGGVYGLSRSGVKVDEDTLRAKEAVLTPLHLNLR